MAHMTLAQFVEAVGQQGAAEALGVNQSAISKALRKGREIFVKRSGKGKYTAHEVRPFPSQINSSQAA
ncbi:Cro/CI family transcriptional regulator [Pseudomonas sp.]|uniref:Cro/CI family transcriptional regulator n=1 Tax=Pseudomonas sp. TaxID=306 RepID=UPI00289A55F3|nr:Cro/CI family transcriptional regulator [Pseudomonas sp.]